MDSLQTKGTSYYVRLCRLLVDKGSEALRAALHVVHPPSTLAAVLNANKSVLKKIRYSVINSSQWNLLYPISGTPDSRNFDVTLLTILLRNICGLPSPATGWNVMPPASDTSIFANITRIKFFRNTVYSLTPSAELDDTEFETLWQEISKPLIKLQVAQQDIDELKVASRSSEEESYVRKLKEWKEFDDDIQGEMKGLGNLAKFDFTGKISDLSKKFHDGTRLWFFEKLSNWFNGETSKIMIVTAVSGVGESVLSAKVCQQYQQRGQLAACHFGDFRNSDYSNPKRILQSLASQMCDSVEGFRDKLIESLRREYSRDSLSDAFRVLLNDPLSGLDRREPMLIVLDFWNDIKNGDESELLGMIFDDFFHLPKWVKVLIGSKEGQSARKKLLHLQSEHLSGIILLDEGNAQ